MFIQTEETHDPATLRFLPGRQVLHSGTRSFADPGEAAAASPLAGKLFEVGSLRRVDLAEDHIALTKDEAADWTALKPAILGVIMDHFTAGAPVLAGGDEFAGPFGADTKELRAAYEAGLVHDGDVVAQIEELMETRILPVVKDQGGAVVLVGFNPDAGRVHLTLEGSAEALLSGIQTMLRHYVPEVSEVVNHGAWVPKPGLDTDEGRAVQALLDAEINPSIAAHGGTVRLIDVADHTAFLEFGGGCQGCGMVDVTLKQGVEVAILEQVPSIVAVLDTTDHANGTNPYYQPKH